MLFEIVFEEGGVVDYIVVTKVFLLEESRFS